MKVGDKVISEGRVYECTATGVDSGAPDFGPPWSPHPLLALHHTMRRFAERDRANAFGADPEPRPFKSEPWR